MRKLVGLLAGSFLVAGLCVAAPVAQAAPLTPALAPDLAGSFQPLATKRVLDTRSGLGGFKGLLAPGHTLTVNLSGARPVPANQVTAAVVDVTVPAPAPAGSLSVYPSGTGWDGRVTMSLIGGGNIQQQLTVRLGADGSVTIRSNAAKPTNVLVDVLGFYVAGTPALPGRFAAANARVLDTRSGLGAPRAAVGAGRKLTLTLAGHGGIPAAGGASAVVASIAVLSAHRTGLLPITTGDGGQATLHLRFVGDQLVPKTMQTQRILRLGSDGTLTFTNTSAASIELVVDVLGYFLAGPVTTEGSYVPQSPHALNSGNPIHIWSNAGFGGRVTGVPTGQVSAVNLVTSTDRPAQPSAISIRDADSGWNRAPQVSSSALLQPTELTVKQGPSGAIVLYSMTNTEVVVHIYVTGYYNHLSG